MSIAKVIEDESDEPEKVEGVIREALNCTGRVFIVLNNPWWGNEKLGEWCRYLFADIEQETDKAYLLKRVINAQEGIRRLMRYSNRPEELQPDDAPDLPRRVAMGRPEKRRVSAWFPKSAVNALVTADPPEEFDLYRVDGSVAKSVSPVAAQATIWEKCVVSGKHRQYRKLAIDCDYDTGQEIKEGLEWDRFHPSPWYQGDEFMCWTVDDKLPQVAERLAAQGISTAVHSSLEE